jgi:tetratricopeptide (TPR) repeat protein
MAKNPAKQGAAQNAPVDTMSPEKRKRLQQCFDRANELIGKDKPDFDYAHDLYAQAVVNDPGNLVYVDAMLANLQKKFKNNKKGSRFNFGGRKAFNEAVADEEWEDIFSEGVEILKSNPWETHVLRELARACAFNRYNEVELRYLKNALDGKPKDVDVNRHCAQSLARMGQFDMAISCWNRVDEKTKGDYAEKMMSELTLAKTMGVSVSVEAIGAVGDRPMAPKPGSAPSPHTEPEAEETPDQSLDVAESTAEPSDKRREIKLNDRQKLERAIRDDPTEIENYVNLAASHSNERRYADAQKILAQAIEAIGPSLKLEAAHEDAQILSAKARVAIAEQRAASEKTEDAKELVTRLGNDLNRVELEIYQKRCQRYPDRLRLRYDLGVRLRRSGNFL